MARDMMEQLRCTTSRAVRGKMSAYFAICAVLSREASQCASGSLELAGRKTGRPGGFWVETHLQLLLQGVCRRFGCLPCLRRRVALRQR